MSEPTDTSGRLNRIEAKLDQVAEAIIKLARVEERTVALQDMVNGVRNEQNDLDDRIRELETSSARQGGGFGVYERGFWVLAASAIGVAAYFVQVFFGS